MVTSTLQVNDENDLFLTDGRNLTILSGAPACLQGIVSRTRMRLGENPFDTNSGVDYFGTVFTPQPDDGAARKSLIDNIQSAPDVLSVDRLDIQVNGDEFKFEAQVMTVYGATTIKE